MKVRVSLAGLVLIAAGAAGGAGCQGPIGRRPAPQAEAAAPVAWIRANQIGYLPGDAKIALLSSATPQFGRFQVGARMYDIGPDCGAWGPFAHNYRLDFSALREPGEYVIRFGDVASLPFRVDARAYADVPAELLKFMQLQRCGENPVTGERCHQLDAIDTLTGVRRDLTGGWHDAADRLKHMITTTYAVATLLLAGEREEGLYGADLVRRIYPAPDTLYVQIGDDRDHLPPHTLWHTDQSDYGWGKGGPRSAWPSTGRPTGPRFQNRSDGLASLAGQAAAALALAGDIGTAKSLYRLACANPGCAMSVPVRAPYCYGEATFHDDLQWAATELFIATREPAYLADAVRFADQTADQGWMGRDRHGHYEFFPYVNLAHWRLHPHVALEGQQRLAAYYRAGLERIRDRALQNPYRLGTPLVWCSTNNVVAFATQAVLYEKLTGDAQFRALATEARDWIFGRNPWGVSFVIGVPQRGNPARHPHHLSYRLAHHLPVGGLVDGPVCRDINDSLKFAPFAADPYARFQSDVGAYHDDFADFSTNEPIIDGTVSLLLLLRLWE